MLRRRLLFIALCTVTAAPSLAQEFDDHKDMLKQLGVRALRRGADPNNQSTFDEATANPYAATMPDVLRMKDGTRVTRPEQWPARRAEILEDFAREVYGRIPDDVPIVRWEVAATTRGEVAGVPTITRTLVGRVDNAAYPQIAVNIEADFTVPADAKQAVPMMISLDRGFFRRRRASTAPTSAPSRPSPAWHAIAISKGWGFGSIDPTSVQPDNNQLTTAGIIGLTNRGKPRKPDQWGALRAWQWGVSRLIDYFEANSDAMVDAKKVGVEGVSRYGKAAIVTLAFDERLAVGIPASSGQGGTKLNRHVFGEAVENLAGGLYYWMAGNYIKYGASDPPMNAGDLPVDSHQLIAACAPRLCFVSHGVVERGDAKWIDQRGSWMAGVLATPVYELLGKRGFETTTGDYLTEPMPPVGKLVGGELAWRQHDGGHEMTPNWAPFFEWVDRYIQSPYQPRAAERADVPAPRTDANSKLAHEQLLEKAKKGKIDVYFAGDSITRRWGTSDAQYADLLANWRQNFFGYNAGNFGWGADKTQHILWRLENGELDSVNPKVIVVLAGTNNVGNEPPADVDAKVADVTAGIKAIVDTCRRKAPDARIILTAIFPRNDNVAVMPTINRINENLAKLGDGKTVRFLNVNDRLAGADGKLLDGMMHDGLHPTVKGYQAWADGIRPILNEWLGPPAATDEAPPPTGDPSAKPR